MRNHGSLQPLLRLLLLARFVASQIPTPHASTFEATLTITEALYLAGLTTVTFTSTSGGSVTTETDTYQLPAILSTTITASSATVTYSGDIYYGLDSSAVTITSGYDINLDNAEDLFPPLCLYPTSGQWSLLPRILFYLTLIFALVARKHEWLIGGALAAALAYSSLAALQTIFQMWTFQNTAELDLLPLTCILGISCIIAVPLMNWSSTIQRLGLEEEDDRPRSTTDRSTNTEGSPTNTEDGSTSTEDRPTDTEASSTSTGLGPTNIDENHNNEQDLSNSNNHHVGYKKKKEYGSTRVVLMFWNLIVMVGFLAAVGGFLLPDDALFPFGISDATSIFCAPSNGYLDPTAGQLPHWSSFWFTAEFIAQNNCVDPCSTSSNINTLFRSSNELQTFSMNDIDHFIETTNTSKQAKRSRAFATHALVLTLLVVPFIILQGVLHVFLFWRSSPPKARWKIYRRLLERNDIRMDANTRRTAWTRFAFFIAWSFYIFATLVLVISPFLFVVTIVASEIFLYTNPQGENNAHLDQWGVFAVTILVLIAALIARLVPGARRQARKENLEQKIIFYKRQYDLLKVDRGETMTVMPRYKKIRLYKQFFHLAKEIFRTAPSWIQIFIRWIKYTAGDTWLRIHHHFHVSREFWDHPHKKPMKRQEEKAEDGWVYKGSEADQKEEGLQKEKRNKEARELVTLQDDAKDAKDKFLKEWRNTWPEQNGGTSQPGGTFDIPQDLSHVEASIGLQGSNAGLQQSLPGISNPSPLPTVSIQRIRRETETPTSPAQLPTQEIEMTPLQSATESRSTQYLARNSQGHSYEMISMSDSQIDYPVPAMQASHSRQNIQEPSSAMPATADHNNPASDDPNNLHLQSNSGQLERLSMPTMPWNQLQTSRRQSQQSVYSLPRKAVPRLLTDSTGDYQGGVSRDDRRTVSSPAQASPLAQLEARISREGMGSRSPSIHSIVFPANTQAQSVDTDAEIQPLLEDNASLHSSEFHDGQATYSRPSEESQSYVVDLDSVDPALEYNVDEAYNRAERHASGIVSQLGYHISRAGTGRSRRNQDND